MTRKLIALFITSLLLFALLPAGVALAAPSATSAITSGADGFPGDRQLTVRVNNTADGNLLIGEKITTVRIHLPVAETGIKTVKDDPGANPGWTGKVTQAGSTTHFITYTADGSGISPGTFADFTFPVTADRPLRSDRSGPLSVQVASGTERATTASAVSEGALDATVRILEILQGSLAPVAPTNADNSKGVTDRTGTAGQTITYAFVVRNYAQEAVDVTGTMRAADENSTDIVDPTLSSQTVSVPGNDATATFNVPVTLGPADGGDRAATFVAGATGTSTSGPSTAEDRDDRFTIQRPADIKFTELNPTRVKPGVSKTFSLRANKTGSQAFELTSSVLTFGTNRATLDEGSRSFAKGSESPTLEYTTTDVISGSNGVTEASVENIGQDDNLADYDFIRAAGQITIDDIVPNITIGVTLPTDQGHQQTAAKNGDKITVAGVITPGTGSDTNDIDTGSLKVVLQPDVGDAITVPVTTTTNGNEVHYSGSTATTWPENAATFVGKATVADTAGNGAGATSSTYLIDLVVPKLDETVGESIVVSPTQIRVKFTDLTGVRGGCDASFWLIDGTPGAVKEVRHGDGALCTAATKDEGVRLLILRDEFALDVDQTPDVTYDGSHARPASLVPAKDGASNDALRQTVQTVTDILPVKPSLVAVDRRTEPGSTSFESAYHDTDEDAYYTNVGGADGIRVTFGGAREGYTIQVLDGQGNVLTQRKITKKSSNPFSKEFQDDTFVPLGAEDAEYARGLRFLSTAGNAGPVESLTLVLDTVVPALAGSTLTAPDTVKTTFSEKIVAGSDYWQDWFVSETIQTEEGTGHYTTNAVEVTSVDALTRTLTVELRDPTAFEAAYYMLTSDGARYEDRAGNTIADSTLP